MWVAAIFLVWLVSGRAARLGCREDMSYRCHATDPSKFVRCAGGKHHEFSCPGGLHFNTNNQICDWPGNADCTEVAEGRKSGGDGETDREGSPRPPRWKTRTTGPRPLGNPNFENRSPDVATTPSSSENRSLEAAKPVWQDSCGSSSCKLPYCHCPSSRIPKGLPAHDTPQMVMLTFDDEVTAQYYGYFQRLFRPGRYNPNGCPVRGAMYVSGEGTDYDLVYPVYAMGNEIGCHTMSHRFPYTWWGTAGYREFYQEIDGMKKNLVNIAGIPSSEIRGFRVPFLQLGGDNMYSALHDAEFTYDTSMFTGPVWDGGINDEPVWPFTLDFPPKGIYCQHGPCPRKGYPGVWEIPVQRWYGLDGHSCAMADGCTATGSAEETLTFLRTNFRRYYDSNRAPFGIFVHARWFKVDHHLDAIDSFIDELLTMNDVWIVTPSQVIEWMKKPTSVYDIEFFRPWSCDGGIKAASK